MRSTRSKLRPQAPGRKGSLRPGWRASQRQAKDGHADKVADILDRFLPEAQSDSGAKLFLIGRNKDNSA
jgi:hypothetical protein